MTEPYNGRTVVAVEGARAFFISCQWSSNYNEGLGEFSNLISESDLFSYSGINLTGIPTSDECVTSLHQVE